MRKTYIYIFKSGYSLEVICNFNDCNKTILKKINYKGDKILI